MQSKQLKIIAVFLLCLVPSFVFAKKTDELSVNWALDGAITGAAGAIWISTELLKEEIARPSCIWCHSNTFDDSVTQLLAWSNPPTAATTSDYLDLLILPALTIGALGLSSKLDDRFENFAVDASLIAEAITVSSLVNQTVKFSVNRARPYTHEIAQEWYPNTKDDNLSFYSGHTSLAFSLAVTAGCIAHERNYASEPYLWAIGLPSAALIGYLRVSAKKHYLSDVLVGSLLGSATGFLVTYLHSK